MISLWKKCREKNPGLSDWLIMNIKDVVLVEWQIEIRLVGENVCLVGENVCPFLLNLLTSQSSIGGFLDCLRSCFRTTEWEQ
uniref:Uncharacterized protein n=1 Tax=Mus musculus TaxID=10090 RepID=Q3TE67_MOUSE|nr:unnamed protein product [Mus musculus]BAE41381.1 unnamed protein product [Mus musculus]